MSDVTINVINIIKEHKDGKISAKSAINTIADYLIPKQLDNSELTIRNVQRLIAFMWNIDADQLMNNSKNRSGNREVYKAKICFTKLLSYTYEEDKLVSKYRLSKLLNMASKHQMITRRLQQHEELYENDEYYKNIYNTLKRILI